MGILIQIASSVKKVTQTFEGFIAVSNISFDVADGSTPVINAISFLLIVGTSLVALANLYFSRKS